MERMTVKYVIDGKDYVTLPLYEMLEDKYKQLEEENKKLNEKVRFLEERLDRKEELNKSYRKEIKDHQFYEEKLEHRIIEFEELLHGE